MPRCISSFTGFLSYRVISNYHQLQLTDFLQVAYVLMMIFKKIVCIEFGIFVKIYWKHKS